MRFPWAHVLSWSRPLWRLPFHPFPTCLYVSLLLKDSWKMCSTNGSLSVWLGTSLSAYMAEAELHVVISLWGICTRFANTSWGQRGHEKRWRLAPCNILGFDTLITVFNLKNINVFKSFKTLAFVIGFFLDTDMASIFYWKWWNISFSKARKCKRMHLNKIKAPKNIFFSLMWKLWITFFLFLTSNTCSKNVCNAGLLNELAVLILQFFL